jgi:hypothetical protein
MKINRPIPIMAGCSLAMLLIGCSRNKPTGVDIPDWNPAGLASTILEKLDKNGDSFVDKGELAEAPGLSSGTRFIDKDGDGQLGREELEARFAMYRDRRVGQKAQELRITHNGRPLVGAEVRLVPEFFLDGIIEPATGTTIFEGMVRPTIADQQAALMNPGYYRVEVTSPSVALPAKFNTATIVGVEVSPFADEPASAGKIEIQLRDKK